MIFFDNMNKEVRRLAQQSIQSLPLLSKRFDRHYSPDEDPEDFSQLFHTNREVNITVEALTNNCQGKLICKTEFFLRKRNKKFQLFEDVKVRCQSQ